MERIASNGRERRAAQAGSNIRQHDVSTKAAAVLFMPKHFSGTHHRASFIAARSMQSVVDQNHRYMLNQMQVQLGQLTKSLEIASITIATNLAVEKSVGKGRASTSWTRRSK